MLRVILVDDEVNSLKSLKWEIDNYCKGVEIIGSFIDPNEAISYIRKNTVDCVFLDIEMPQIDGFGFLKHFYERDFYVVFVTAYNSYAIKAIKEEAVDYLLKPVDTDELVQTIEKIKSLLKTKAIQNISLANYQRVALPAAGKIIYVKLDEILYCESDGNYTRVFMTNGDNIFITKKIKEIHALFDDNLFKRIHNSYVINMLKVAEFIKTDNYVVLDNQSKIPVSRNKRHLFLDN